VLQELCNVFLGKLSVKPEELVDIIDSLLGDLVAHTPSVPYYERAIGLKKRYGLSFYDALIVQAAIDLGCETLYSEDLQDGQKFGTLTVTNPFLHPV
jgi:predicted nucleic acid-binding protein